MPIVKVKQQEDKKNHHLFLQQTFLKIQMNNAKILF
jgi:hypothetical protein